MEKTVEYYMSLPYTFEMTYDSEHAWFIRVKELPGCMSQGNDPTDAIEMIKDAMAGWLEISLEDGNPIPEPASDEGYSGKFVVRLPRSLHRQLAETASREGVSLNQLVNVSLARAVERTNPSAGYPVRMEQPLAVSEKKRKYVTKKK